VELIHHHVIDVGVRPLSHGLVGEDLGRAADDRRLGVDRRVPGHHPHELGPEIAGEREELLVDEGLDRRRVIALLPLGDGDEMEERRHQRFPRAGGRRQDHVLARDELEQGLLLRGVQGEALVGDVVEEAIEQVVGEELSVGRREAIGEGGARHVSG
jgi:hypothetical protein